MENKNIEAQVVKHLKNILDGSLCCKATGDGYVIEIYADYNDKLSDTSIRKIFEAACPKEGFFDVVTNLYEYADECEHSEIIRQIEAKFDDDEQGIYFTDHKDFIRDWVYENVYTIIPYSHYENMNVYINIIVDAGDANYDFALNNLFNFYRNSEPVINNESSLVWLIRQQGYADRTIELFLNKRTTFKSKFLKSVLEESENTSSSMNALTFMIKLPLIKAIELVEYVKAGEGNIRLSQKSTCGLYDAWYGSTGLLDIALKKDVVLPVKLIDSVLPDGMRGHGIADIAGLCRSEWHDNCVSWKTAG